jgi:hypothetical protein
LKADERQRFRQFTASGSRQLSSLEGVKAFAAFAPFLPLTRKGERQRGQDSYQVIIRTSMETTLRKWTRSCPTKSGSKEVVVRGEKKTISWVGLDFFREDKDAQQELKRRAK